MVSPVSIQTALNQQDKTAAASTKLSEDFSQFLTLLTIQLQNQDPLSPMDSTEFTNQLVAFSGVEQQINTNQKLDSLVAMQLSNGFTGALSYVGLDVSYLSSEMNFDGATPVKISYAVDGDAISGKVNVRDDTGKSIYSKDINRSAGPHDFSWDGSLTSGGKALPGTYTVTVDALDKDGKALESSTVVTGRVRGVETQNGLLHVLAGDRAVPVANILNATQPATAPASDEEDA